MHILLASTSATLAQRVIRVLRHHTLTAVDSLAATATVAADMLIIDFPTQPGTLRELATQLPADLPVLLLVSQADLPRLTTLRPDNWHLLVLPLREQELELRVRLMQAWHFPSEPLFRTVAYEEFTFTLPDHTVTRHGEPVALTQKESALALLLLSHLGRPLSRTTIRDTIWGQDSTLPGRTIDTHVSRVRTKLGLIAANGYALTPVYGYGYQLVRTAPAGD